MSFLASAAKALFRRSNEPSAESLYRYTSGRWLYNEVEQLAARRVEFNVAALKHVAAQAAGARRCTRIAKTHEGSFSKVYLLEFDNHSSLVAKIPNKLIPPFYTTASEVATMDYARTILGLPVPRVLAWNARADATTNSVGAEYILMEKAEGVELHHRWDTFHGRQVAPMIEQALRFENVFATRKFSQIGSLYYKEDVEEALQARPLYAADGGNETPNGAEDKFRMGPLVDWDVWRGTRSCLNVSRGPWTDAVSYIRGIIRIEQEWLRQYAKPFRQPFDRWTGGSAEEHIELLERLYILAPHIVPPPELCSPVLWHIDLHGANIFIDSSEQPKITSIIDWQSASILPLYMQATFAAFAQYTGDDVIYEDGLVYPVLRVSLEDAPRSEHARLSLELKLALFQKIYEIRLQTLSPWNYAVHVYPCIEQVRTPVQRASRTWCEGIHRLRQSIFEIICRWDEIAPGIPLPLEVGQDEWERHQASFASQEKYEARIQMLRKELKLASDGWTPDENYEIAQEQSRKFMEEWNEEAEGGPYPFQDGAPSWFVGS